MARESLYAYATSFLRAQFSSFFGSRREEEEMQTGSEEGFVVTSGCSSYRIENAIFLLLHWFKREKSFTIYFSCFAIQI